MTMITLNTICRKAEQINRAEERKMKIAAFLKGCLATLALGAAFYLALAIPSYIHSRDCDGCDWFWCNHYTEKGMI